jgi:DNA-binding transcriptional LysR family regulator
MLELRQLRHFMVVAEELSFTRAARKIPIAQSALSASVRSLERRLHTELFRRTGHSVVLTESGEVLLVEARKVLRAADEAEEAVADVEGGIRGRLRIGILQSLAFGALTDLLITFRRRWPLVQMEVRVEPRGSRELLRAVQRSRLDIAFVTLPDAYPQDVHVTPLSSEPLALVTPDDHPLAGKETIAIDDLGGEEFVDYPEGWGIRRIVDQVFSDRHLEREIIIEVADCSTARQLALGGLGLAFVITSALPGAEPAPHRTEPAIEFEVSLIASKQPASRAATKAFVTVVEEMFSPIPRRATN